ncbi:CHASE2 domain-containing serine/threonine-protein kinase [Usitatibacter palustris]|uniref:non-specific serine/threonine protein kinase n=1 Tax=Usitatibacter palustris TaxID=2732487 RepID=A0A6M4H913_9PROT|nr:serine/threonine-protein kinase [Usitatibacter palustris]QJR16229.1 Serine/threonine-protein kinase PknD [Usitatibacter palustris]
MKTAFWKADWFLGLVIAIAMLVFAKASGFIPGVERWAYDLGVRMTSKIPSDKIAVIAIDEPSIRNIGRWPWSREVQAKLIDQLAASKAKVIGNTIILSEPQKDAGLVYVERMLDVYNKAWPSAAPQEAPGVSAFAAATPAAQPSTAPPDVAEIGKILHEASTALNSDLRLADSMKKAGNVIVPLAFQGLSGTPPPGKPDKPTAEYVAKNTIGGTTQSGGGQFLYGVDPLLPIEQLGVAAAGIGHLNSNLDEDGAVRFEPLVIDFYGQQYPSLALMIAAKSLNLGPKDVKANVGESVSVGGKVIRTDDASQMYTYFYKDRDGRPAFPIDSFFDVYSGKIPTSKYTDKIVLIGATAAGVGAAQVTPISPQMNPVTTLAHSVSSIMQEHFFVAPTWGGMATLGAYLLIALYLILLLPRLGAGMGAIVTLVLLAALFGTHLGLMTSAGLWIQLMLPATLLIVGHALLTTKRYLVTEAGKEKADTEGAESNRMLGLAFQQQGQLDMAFDKFRKCPYDEQLAENLYSLALDFERRRQFNKAESVFGFIAAKDPKFKDVAERAGRNKAMSETIILGGSSGARTNATMVMAGGAAEKPMLGRYQIEKELGKGAMGVVYGGKDPKIGRVVAIKTMALSAEFEADELTEAKERFFREAETAGRLTHPSIVTIYDAGEEHDLCYIAMEFLKGKDLVQFTKNPNLLPPDKVLSIVERVADALGYAHTLGVVHRDIKPANIMYEPDSDVAKVTDFGIARITDSSKTKTGMVLGTPSYMSPEQLAGKRIDGRSDIFSLGVTLFQMLCGQLPFNGESMTQLMFAIANTPHPNILEINSALKPWMVVIIDKALAKDLEQRYQTGMEFAAAIREARKANG